MCVLKCSENLVYHNSRHRSLRNLSITCYKTLICRFDCTEAMKLCSFGGRQFDCCKFMEPIITNLGKCHYLDMRKAREWMRKQTVAGVNAGLQIILDAHMEEQFDDNSDPIFSNAFENGYRYYVHAPDTIPYLVSEGISVSPGTRVYSAISTNTYILLSSENWGNCSDKWPSSYNTTLPYSSVNCGSLCKANYFYDRCGCSPFTYNIDMCEFFMLHEFSLFRYLKHLLPGTDYFYIPQCQDCKIECHSLVYHAYNSYGKGFSHGALKWLSRKNSSWKIYLRSNFLTVNVFFRDMAHTEYRQVQATSLTEVLSEYIMLKISMTNVRLTSALIDKLFIGWIAFSKRRRDYLYNKKKSEKEREKQLEETVSGFNMFRIKKVADVRDSFRVTQSRLRAFGKEMRDSFRVSKPKGLNVPPLYSSVSLLCL
ncbi:unnamed protein product [Angiostrongylus costaricensis]|uniref:Amiloride-sensitive sodium channel n=1 Tax=Angiostrongylus costaricensis TaxID=334426 RepID=A0A158PM96_ANGCS|nr:unnamed protein product [Angiostrongylus costaricensis]